MTERRDHEARQARLTRWRDFPCCAPCGPSTYVRALSRGSGAYGKQILRRAALRALREVVAAMPISRTVA